MCYLEVEILVIFWIFFVILVIDGMLVLRKFIYLDCNLLDNVLLNEEWGRIVNIIFSLSRYVVIIGGVLGVKCIIVKIITFSDKYFVV